ncbi:beta-ketoacyl synthase N-terminal-like domain-containing protein [Streptomyces sp. NPDC002088]|uniref:beta-ketoacyl synthase N-terminal-like domain-containing protein n=1 Tax=Streptomyces sp. NPDC002088 TaxID=3154665 RepID=UPI0033336760
MSAAELVVTGIGTTSPWGRDPARLALDAVRPPITGEPWFDLAAELGGRGYKYLPPSCRYLLAATRRALADADDPLSPVPESRRGMAVGTNNAVTALLDAMDETMTTSGAEKLSPATAPFFATNTIPSRVAMEHGLKGWNLTVTTPQTAGLEAVLAGTRAVTAGRSTMFLAGAVEEALPPHQPGHDISEAGAAVLVLEPRAAAAARGRTGHGTCRVVTFFLPHASPTAPVASHTARQAVGDAFARLLPDPEAAPPTRLIADDSPVGTAVAEQIRSLGAEVDVVPPGAGALLPMLHVSRGLARPGPPHLVATACRDGSCALALVSPERAA